LFVFELTPLLLDFTPLGCKLGILSGKLLITALCLITR
jgi:hypothetical protein